MILSKISCTIRQFCVYNEEYPFMYVVLISVASNEMDLGLFTDRNKYYLYKFFWSIIVFFSKIKTIPPRGEESPLVCYILKIKEPLLFKKNTS